MANATPFWCGKASTVKAFVDGSQVTFKIQSWTCKQNSVVAEDALVGEDGLTSRGSCKHTT